MVYLLALLGNFFKLDGKFGKILYVPTYLVNSNWAAMKGLFSYLTGRQAYLWKRVSRGEDL